MHLPEPEMTVSTSPPHSRTAFADLRGTVREGLTLDSRRNFLKVSLAGLAGLSLPRLLEQRAAAGPAKATDGKSVILLWMAGGPSHIDTWDSKPDRPWNNRGPFGVTQTKIPGIVICDRLPKQAAMLDDMTLIRSVDCRFSNHEPNMVMQSGHPEAELRLNPQGDKYPSIASIVAKHHGPNHPGMPAYVAFQTGRSHIGYGGWLGKQYDPFIANRATKLPVYTNVGVDTGNVTGADLFQLPKSLSVTRLKDRQTLAQDFDRLRSGLDQSGIMEASSLYQRQALEMLVGKQAQTAFDLSLESDESRSLYGSHLWCQQALIARRLVERGAAFVTLDLSYHASSGTWDTHGDNIPPYGGISKGLGPLLPLFDHLLTTLVSDLKARGLLDKVLVIAMGEFGRTPFMGSQGSSDGRDHWPNVSSICLAGGGLRHGQVIGKSDRDGALIAERPVTPADLAATIYRHMGVSLETQFLDDKGRPNFVVRDSGQPIMELF